MNEELTRVAFALFMSATLVSCAETRESKKLKKQQDIAIILDCEMRWQYQELKEKERLTVIYFAASRKYDIYFNPNCVIGVNQNDDTMAVIDHTYPCPRVFIPGELIDVSPMQWKESDKETTTLMGYTDAGSKLICSLKYIYYGQFNWHRIPPTN